MLLIGVQINAIFWVKKIVSSFNNLIIHIRLHDLTSNSNMLFDRFPKGHNSTCSGIHIVALFIKV